MYNYLKITNRTITILCLIFFLTSVCFIQYINANNTLIEEEVNKIKEVVNDITEYINTSMFCFEPTTECKQENQKHLDNMTRFIIDKGWKYEDCLMKMALKIDTNGEQYLILGVAFKSYVKPGKTYNVLWMMKKTKKDKKLLC